MLAVAAACVIGTLAVAGASLVVVFEKHLLEVLGKDLDARWAELARKVLWESTTKVFFHCRTLNTPRFRAFPQMRWLQHVELAFDYYNLIQYFKPAFVLMENVTDIIKNQKGDYAKFAFGRLLALRYQVRLGLIPASDHGAPQTRWRWVEAHSSLNSLCP